MYIAQVKSGARIDERTGKLIKPVNDTKNDTKTTSAIAAKLGMSIATIKRDFTLSRFLLFSSA